MAGTKWLQGYALKPLLPLQDDVIHRDVSIIPACITVVLGWYLAPVLLEPCRNKFAPVIIAGMGGVVGLEAT